MSYLPQTEKSWKLNESNLTDEQKALLEKVCFPKEVATGKVLQKRIRRHRTSNIYVDKQSIGLEDIRYLTADFRVATQQILKDTKFRDANGRPLEGAARQKALKNVEKQKESKPVQHVFISPLHVENELNDLFATYCTPQPSKNMIVEDVKEEVKEEAVIKNLSPTQKGQVKELYNQSNSANEIAAQLGLDLERVIKYLKTLS